MPSAPSPWMSFAHFMHRALYDPEHGYYLRRASQIAPDARARATGPSDFVTAPTLSPCFGHTLAVQLAQLLQLTGCDEVWEFGAGTGALAAQLLLALGQSIARYHIVELSAPLHALQRRTLQETLPLATGNKVVWHTRLPQALRGVVIGNEVLDAMPVTLLARVGGVWHERGVQEIAPDTFAFADVVTALRPPVCVAGEHDYVTEIHPQAFAFVRTVAQALLHHRRASGEHGALLLIDYGYPEHEYYHPQRAGGTLMCHRAHKADSNPLVDIGQKDITAHVNFTGVALAAQEVGLHINGYTSQARFLLNCGFLHLLRGSSVQERTLAHRLVAEHEMGELFKVLCCSTHEALDLTGFGEGDRTHAL